MPTKSGRQFGTVFVLTVFAAFSPRPAFTQNFECSPNAYPVKNFAGHVETVEEDTRKLASFMRGAEWKSLNGSFETDLNRLRNLPKVAPLLISNTPVADVLQVFVNNSTIFNWKDTASALGAVERDLRNQRTRVLESDSAGVAAMRATIADTQKAPDVIATTLGKLSTVRGRTEEIRDTYLDRAFNHLSSCLASCPVPKGYDLGALRVLFTKFYGDAASNRFVRTAEDLGHARTSVEDLPHAVQALISESPTDSFSTTVMGAKEAANLKNAADQLADAQRGSWTSVGEQNQKVLRVIGMLRAGVGYQGNGRPGPLQLIAESLGATTKAQNSIDDFVQTNSKLLGDLHAFLDQYNRSYQPGCRPNNTAAGRQ